MKEDKQDRIDHLYLRMARIWSENSYAIRRKVGCLIVKGNSIISDGYNGTPSGFPNVCEFIPEMEINGKDERQIRRRMKSIFKRNVAELVTLPYVLHAESNAIAKLAKSNNSSDGATIYITDEPCLECSKMIIQAGIRRVIYQNSYRIHDGIELLQKAGIEIKQIIL